MPARYRQPHGPRRALPRQLDLRGGPGVLELPIPQLPRHRDIARLGLVGAAVAAHPDTALMCPAGQRRGTRVIQTHHQHPFGTQGFGEFVEHRGVSLHAAEVIQVIRLDIGHDDQVRPVLQ